MYCEFINDECKGVGDGFVCNARYSIKCYNPIGGD